MLEHLSELKESLQDYIEARTSYYGLLALEKTVKLVTRLLSGGLLVVVLLVAVLFLSAAAALYIGTLLGSAGLGLLITGGFYLLLGLIVYLFRKRLFSSCVTRILVHELFGDDAEGNSP